MNRTFQEQEYRARINRVIDYIQNNLDKKLTVTHLAEIACFSPFHFHRIFSAVVGETLTSFIQRLRVEKAASMLVNNPKKSITEIAFDVGFATSASFARLFRDFFGMSASVWRNGGYRHFSKIRLRKNKSGLLKSKIRQPRSKNGQTISNNGKDPQTPSWYIYNRNEKDGATRFDHIVEHSIGRSDVMSIKEPTVIVENLPATTVAYIRHIGPYKGNEQLFTTLYERLMTWAGPRGLLGVPGYTVFNIYHDDPEITDENNLRISVCISVPPETVVDGEIGKMVIDAGAYAIAHFELNANEYQEAWDYVFGKWLPASGYQCDDRPCFERCSNDPNADSSKKHCIDICVPVKPL